MHAIEVASYIIMMYTQLDTSGGQKHKD